MSNNYEGLRGLFVNEGLAYQYERNVGLIPSSIRCPHCEQPTDLYTDNFEVYKQRRICHHCQHTYSILTGTIFTRSKLLICQVLHLIYCWCQQYSCQQTAFECQVHANTVTNYFSCLRDCCYNEIMDSPIQMIGGPGQVVEIDESALTTRKYNRGRAPAQQIWVFGGICRQTHERFCFVVPLRNTAILSKYIISDLGQKSYLIAGKLMISLISSLNLNHISTKQSIIQRTLSIQSQAPIHKILKECGEKLNG